ncbi:hypothetical protein VM1G_08086 [Cytospora mali]|uniref:Gfd2/YDR514C-like C-terminal domain-containing protein n=1 Tax=Cytospora mali TaxID=578113 RepID=A0A194W6P1_CYTMA|nr:hypothetical protein VM1G_08086 [Valsa mali]
MEELERLFRISPSKPPLDAIIVSVDLETSGSKGKTLQVNRKEVSGVREIGFAILDTRVLFPPLPRQKAFKGSMNESLEESNPHMISTHQFSTSHASEDLEDCDNTDFEECVFSRTRYIIQDNLNDTIARYIQFPEDTTARCTKDTTGLRAVVIVGHSPERDLEIIRRLGVSINRIAPVAAIIDTYRLSRYILGPDSPLGKSAPLQKFALWNVLTELGVPYNWYDLHNAGNDATYTLYTLIMLAARWTEYKGGAVAAAGLRAFVEGEAAAPRWKPVRNSLGAHRVEEEVRNPVVRLGSGLVAVAKSLRLSSSEAKKVVKSDQ